MCINILQFFFIFYSQYDNENICLIVMQITPQYLKPGLGLYKLEYNHGMKYEPDVFTTDFICISASKSSKRVVSSVKRHHVT